MSENTKKNQGGKSKIRPEEIFFNLVRAISKEFVGARFPKFPHSWRAVSLSSGVKQIYEESDKGLFPVSDHYVYQKILEYCQTQFRPEDPYHLNVTKAKQLAENWIAMVKPISPILFSYKDEPKISYVRLPWKSGEHLFEKTPLFDELFSRMSNAVAFKKWIGSLFVDGTDRQQYVWVYGRGGEGKGALLRVLHHFMGELLGVKQVRKEGEAHWSSGLVGKRLIAFPDTNNSAFCLSGYFKSLTGDDPVEVNEKFKPHYTTRISAKFIFFSNTTPDVTSANSDRRRLIYVHIDSLPKEPTPEEVGAYERKLILEAPAFLDKCIEEFKYQREDLGIPIECDYDQYDLLSEDNEEYYVTRLEGLLEFGPLYTMTPYEMQATLGKLGVKNGYEIKRYKEILDRVFQVRKVQRRGVTGVRARHYEGCRRKPQKDLEIGPSSFINLLE